MLEASHLRRQLQALNSSDETTRREALQSMKQIERADWDKLNRNALRPVLETLRKQLPRPSENGSKPPLFRQEVATILGNIGPRSGSAIGQLVDLLAEGVPDGVREAAATALGKIGKESRVGVDQLIHILQSNCRIALADRVARALGEIGCADQRVRNALTHLWLYPVHSHSNQVQVAIALCKLRIEAHGLLKTLTATLVTSRDTSLRKSAAEALAWCSKNDLDVVPALTAAMKDDDEDVRKLAEAALTQMNVTPVKAVQICAQQIKDSVHAEAALRKSGAASVPGLVEALKAKEPLAREKASRTLGSIGEVAIEAAPALKAILNDKQLEVRLAAAKALWNIAKDADSVVPVLADLLGGKPPPAAADSHDLRRGYYQSVIEALCRIGQPAKGAIPALNRKAKDENRLIRESAQRALREIGPPLPKKAS